VLRWKCTRSRRSGSHGRQLDEKSSGGYGGKASRITPQAQGSSLGQSRKRQHHVLISNTVIWFPRANKTDHKKKKAWRPQEKLPSFWIKVSSFFIW
jgi:hypothetical protein